MCIIEYLLEQTNKQNNFFVNVSVFISRIWKLCDLVICKNKMTVNSSFDLLKIKNTMLNLCLAIKYLIICENILGVSFLFYELLFLNLINKFLQVKTLLVDYTNICKCHTHTHTHTRFNGYLNSFLRCKM